MTIILFGEGFEEIEAVTPLDLLRRAGIESVSIGIGNRTITGSHGISIQTDTEISEFNRVPDNIIVPGGMPGSANIAASEKACALIKQVFASGGLVASICAAPAVVLYPLGILDGKKATCFPGNESNMIKAIYTDEPVVTDGNVITAKAAGSAIPFSLEIIRYLKNGEQSDEIKSRIHFS